MDVDNRGLEDGDGRDDEENGFTEDSCGLPDDPAEYFDEATSEADAEAGDDERVDEETDAVEPLAADTRQEGEEANLPDDVYEIDPSPHSLLSVLFPAKPPRPRNARIVRLFDIEAAKHDAEPGEEPAVEPPKEEPRTREAIRAARNQSLLVAARLR